ncbi:transporter substrate-binding domain-containing protein [Clostridium cylindrosporum]|uniref:Amino acid ABC transporter substrate-binding protein, PAAT family n=1 Tax=Clostridium cylindrosporum DSM 605 TaxID=1121307 RepID=A0A0J8G684_CLOCY|nr:transporter substrate-binding domain-containing protein [Clostridium cylindrosporum]KMT23126.1 amino acid ABC transporter substrate-binding protein, PAAT family [Clostridium cylindrosporum DSM 605]
MVKGLLKKVTVGILSTVMIFSLVSCSNSKEAGQKPSGIVDKIKQSKKIILATNPEFPPFEFRTVKSGKSEVVGADIALAQEIAKDLGVKLEIKSMNFDGLLEALNAGNIDMVVAGMTPTDKRRQSVDFSELYYKDSPQTLLIRKENAGKIKSVNDLKGLTVGAQKGSIQEEIVKNEFKASKPKAVANIPNLIQELKNKNIDALVLEKVVAEQWIKKTGTDITMAPFEVGVNYSGIAVAIKKGNKDLVDSVNKTIARVEKENLMQKFIKDANALNEKK